MLSSRSSIRTLLIQLGVALVVPLLALVTYFAIQSARVELDEAQQGLRSRAEATALAIQQFLYDAEQVLARVANHPAVRAMDAERCRALAPELRELFLPGFTNVIVWSLDEHEVCSAVPLPGGEVQTEAPEWLEGARVAEGFWVGPVHRGGRTGLWATGLTYPIRNPEGSRIGLVVAGLDLLQFQRILARMEPWDGIVTVVHDTTIVARSRDNERWVGRKLVEDPDTRVLGGEGRDGRTTVALSQEGETLRWDHARVENAPWLVYAGVEESAIFGPVRRKIFISSFLTLALLLGALLVGARSYRRITDPLAALVKEVSSASPEDPSPLEVRGPREIALLTQRLNEAWRAVGEAERERRRSDERIHALVENAINGVYVSTAKGRFLEVNQALVDLLGYGSREELLATPASALYQNPEERERLVRENLGKGFSRGLQVRWVRKDGAPLTVRLFARGIETESGEGAWEVIVEDMTPLLTLQEQLLQGQKMEALGRLAGGIAHDFNNLLTVVQGQADLMLEDPSVGEDLHAQLREISDAAARGGALNRQLLAFGRRSAVERTSLDLNRVVQGIEIMLRRAAGEEILVEVALSPEVGWIRGDRSQVEQVIMNLVVNARDAMPRGGALTLGTSVAEVAAEELLRFPQARTGPHAVLEVKDTGTGIDPTVLPHIFEPFFTTKPEMQGTGLGLSTVYGIVAESGGHIRVESVAGAGTTFRVFFPSASEAAEDERESGDDVVRRTGSGVILVAEDEESVRKLAVRVLQRAGYDVIPATSGSEALELARSRTGPIHLLLSDVVMPGLRGPELAELLAREGKISRAVLFSGYADGLRDGGPEGVERWELLSKPFNASELLGAIQRVMNG